MGIFSRFRSQLVPALESHTFVEPWGLNNGKAAFELTIRRVGCPAYQKAIEETGTGKTAGAALTKLATKEMIREMMASATGSKQEAKPGFRRAKKATKADRAEAAAGIQARIAESIEDNAEEMVAEILAAKVDPMDTIPALATLIAGWRALGDFEMPEFSPDSVASELFAEQTDDEGHVLMLPSELPNPRRGEWLYVPEGEGEPCYVSQAKRDELVEAGASAEAFTVDDSPTVEIPYGGQPIHLAMMAWVLDKAEEAEDRYRNGLGAAEGN